jgi:hypothetical protein
MNKQQFKDLIKECIREVMSEAEGGYRYNVAKVPLKTARAYAEAEFQKNGKKLEDYIPDFDKNYIRLQKACKVALDIPRIEMPVIEPQDMKTFTGNLAKGNIDIFSPHVYKSARERFPKDLDTSKGKEWITLGQKDGNPKDDVMKGKWTKMPAIKLKPTQSQIWLEKLVGNIIKFGVPESGSPVTKATVISSKEGYILDGHHRYGQAMLANPPLKLSALWIPLDIKTLLALGRSYGNAIGNQQKG